jgi:hypothetical protein
MVGSPKGNEAPAPRKIRIRSITDEELQVPYLTSRDRTMAVSLY